MNGYNQHHINSIDELRLALTLDNASSETIIVDTFDAIAHFLIEKCAIKKGNNYYLFTDIEFYFYNQNHKDIITHPRNSEALQWFINDFGGIDINFKSHVKYESCTHIHKKAKPELSTENYFGGILIRALKNEVTGQELVGPWACAELFRIHDAVFEDKDFPLIVEYESGFKVKPPQKRLKLKRKNRSAEYKVKYILSGYSNGSAQDISGYLSAFTQYEEKEYRYTI